MFKFNGSSSYTIIPKEVIGNKKIFTVELSLKTTEKKIDESYWCKPTIFGAAKYLGIGNILENNTIQNNQCSGYLNTIYFKYDKYHLSLTVTPSSLYALNKNGISFWVGRAEGSNGWEYTNVYFYTGNRPVFIYEDK